LYSGYELWRLRLFSFCGYELALAALALLLFGAYDSYPDFVICFNEKGSFSDNLIIASIRCLKWFPLFIEMGNGRIKMRFKPWRHLRR